MFCWIDGLAVPLVFDTTACAGPDVLVCNVVGMRGGDSHITMGKCPRTFTGPLFELLAVRIVFDSTDDKVCQVAILMS